MFLFDQNCLDLFNIISQPNYSALKHDVKFNRFDSPTSQRDDQSQWLIPGAKSFSTPSALPAIMHRPFSSHSVTLCIWLAIIPIAKSLAAAASNNSCALGRMHAHRVYPIIIRAPPQQQQQQTQSDSIHIFIECHPAKSELLASSNNRRMVGRTGWRWSDRGVEFCTSYTKRCRRWSLIVGRWWWWWCVCAFVRLGPRPQRRRRRRRNGSLSRSPREASASDDCVLTNA